jgi:hypothetical protein
LAPCAVCKEPIQAGALKCIHCESYLDWRGYLAVSQTTLALLIALISVVSSMVPPLVDWMSRHYSDIHAEVRQPYLDRLEISVANTGNRPGMLVSVSLAALKADGNRVGPILLQTQSDGVVGPGQSIVAQLTIHPEDVVGFLAWPHHDIAKCFLEARIANFGSKPETIEVDCSGESFQKFCKGTEGAATERHKVPALHTSRCI